MRVVKLSVSIPDEDVEFLDDYAKNHNFASRSAALHRAIRLLRASELADAYEAAFTEWDDDADNDAWDVTASDGASGNTGSANTGQAADAAR
jgi:Arc/MetJ-type ribon-helix-helix transcriptional regulator